MIIRRAALPHSNQKKAIAKGENSMLGFKDGVCADPLAGPTQLIAGTLPADNPFEQGCSLGIKVGEARSQKLADNQRVQHCGEILCGDNQSAPISARAAWLPGS
jgi:hypothetical protein